MIGGSKGVLAGQQKSRYGQMDTFEWTLWRMSRYGRASEREDNTKDNQRTILSSFAMGSPWRRFVPQGIPSWEFSPEAEWSAVCDNMTSRWIAFSE